MTIEPAEVDALRLAVVRLARRLRKAAGPGGLTPSQHSALYSLSRHGPSSLSELARFEQISKPTVTRLVATLAAKGLIDRSADDSDGRSSIVVITPQGRDLLAGFAETSNDYLRERLAALESEDLARVLGSLKALTQLAERP